MEKSLVLGVKSNGLTQLIKVKLVRLGGKFQIWGWGERFSPLKGWKKKH